MLLKKKKNKWGIKFMWLGSKIPYMRKIIKCQTSEEKHLTLKCGSELSVRFSSFTLVMCILSGHVLAKCRGKVIMCLLSKHRSISLSPYIWISN